MKTITLNEANKNLPFYVNYAISSSEEVNIATDNGSIIMINEDNYNSMLETLKLLSDKKSLKALLDSHFARDNNIEIKKYSIEEVFNDV